MARRPPGRPRRGEGDGPDPDDILVGARIRQRRDELGITQQRLAAELGISFQQVQKYERGTNRVSASRLHRICQVLEASVAFFLADEGAVPIGGFAEPPMAAFDADPLRRPETIELVDAYFGIVDAELRRRLVDVAKVLTGPQLSPGGAGATRRLGRGPKSRLTGEVQGSTRAPRPRGRPHRTPK